MSHHYPKSIMEVWNSYEWLIKEKLEALDHYARCMFREMAGVRSGASNQEIRVAMGELFAELWEQVAEEQDSQAKYKRRSEGA